MKLSDAKQLYDHKRRTLPAPRAMDGDVTPDEIQHLVAGIKKNSSCAATFLGGVLIAVLMIWRW